MAAPADVIPRRPTLVFILVLFALFFVMSRSSQTRYIGETRTMFERSVMIRAQSLTVAQALHRSLAHASYHVGQIVYVAKALRGADWQSLSIPPGQSARYNQAPTLERGPRDGPPAVGRRGR